MSLPPSVCEESDGRCAVDNDDAVSLPPSVHDGMFEEACCKRGKCQEKIAAEALQEYKLAFDNLSQSDRLARVYEAVRFVSKETTEKKASCFQWSILGQPVCRRFWEMVHTVGHGTLDNMVKLAKAGHPTLPPRGPRMERASPASTALDAWFLTVYRYLAEPLAIPGSGDMAIVEGPEAELAELTDVNHPLFLATVVATWHARQRSHSVWPPGVLWHHAIRLSQRRLDELQPSCPDFRFDIFSSAGAWRFTLLPGTFVCQCRQHTT